MDPRQNGRLGLPASSGGNAALMAIVLVLMFVILELLPRIAGA